jgi:hypothetical protein
LIYQWLTGIFSSLLNGCANIFLGCRESRAEIPSLSTRVLASPEPLPGILFCSQSFPPSTLLATLFSCDPTFHHQQIVALFFDEDDQQMNHK